LKYLIKTTLKYATPLVIFFGGLCMQQFSTDPQSMAFARAGCLIVLYGIILESLYVIRATSEGATIPNKLIISGKNESRKHLTTNDYLTMLPSHYGLIWICLGTIIWGFGDLLR
jgi:hypothetical protein